MSPPPNPDESAAPLSVATRLAYERTFLAHERTQMAWIRTALSLISFGFTIAKFFEFLRDKQGTDATMVGAPTVGTFMITMGLIALILGSLQNFVGLRRLRRECPELPRSVSWVTAILLALVGLAALISASVRN